MAQVTNESKNPVVLSDGTFIAIGESAEVKDWATVKKHHVTIAMLDGGGLRADSAKEDASEKESLLAQLKALGVDAQANSKVETLQRKLDEALAAQAAAEAEAAAKLEVTAQLKEKGIEFAETESLEELKAKLAAAQ